MKNNRFKSSTKKLIGKKYFLPIALITIIVALCSYSTLAWVVSNTNAIENKFKLQTADISLEETFTNNVKSNVYVKNTGEATMYIRVALVEELKKGDSIVPNTTNNSYFTYTGLDNTNWIKIGDYYYYKTPVAGGAETSKLFTQATPNYTTKDGETLSLYVMTEAIQVNGIDEWNVGVNADGEITGGKK